MARRGLGQRGGRGGFTLIEAMLAAAVLGVTMLAVATALSASQNLAFEGQKRVLAAMAADDLMSELVTLDYDTLRARDGESQPIGAIATVDGVAYPESYWFLGRDVTVTPTDILDEGSGMSVSGVLVRVDALDAGATLASVETFVPEPSP